ITVGGGWSTARPASLRPAVMPWGATTPLEQNAAAAWGSGQPHDMARQLLWDAMPTKDAANGAAWEQGMSADRRALAGPWGDVPAKDAGYAGCWDHSIRPRDIRLLLIYNPRPARKDVQVRAPSRRVDQYGPRYD